MVLILMAVYNGEAFIADQIKSILEQSYQDFVLYINDDASTDSTFDIAKQFSAEFPGKIIVTKNHANSGGAKHNFFDMMSKYKNDYIMLCDQDDIWLPDKIKVTLAEMKKAETTYTANTPILIHTDLRVVNENLSRIVSHSFKEAMNANYSRTLLRDQVIQNTLTGCTAMYNKSLANLIEKKPRFMVMHDWWLMLIASAFGEIVTIDEQTILYRQHSKNLIGAKDVRKLLYKVNKLLRYREIKTALSETYIQSQSFLDIYKDRLTSEQIELLEVYCKIPEMYKLKRLQTILRLGTRKNGLSRNIAYSMFV